MEEDDESQSGDNGDDDVDDDYDDEESTCNKVICVLKESDDLGALNLRECKIYLRKHGLRLSGTKTVCTQRIREHWGIKDGNGEALYPKSFFAINCTGGVCQGDFVLFTQKVYQKFVKVTRHGQFFGKSTIAGRVVSDSYGIEILWSKGTNKLPTLFPLLVKGRNLYKLKTFRQLWNNEAERLKVLAEKHKRGSEAIFVRAMRKSRKTWFATRGTKQWKHFHRTQSSEKQKTTESEKGKQVRLGKVIPRRHANFNEHYQVAPPPTTVNFE